MFAIKLTFAKPPDNQRTRARARETHKSKSKADSSYHTRHQNIQFAVGESNAIQSSEQLIDLLLHSHNTVSAELWIVYCLFKQAGCTNRGSQPNSPGLSSPSQSQTAETNQIITTTMSHLGQKNPIPELTILTQTKVSHTVRSFTCELSSHAQQYLLWYERRRVRKGNTSSKHTHTHTHLQGSPTHGLLIWGCGFLDLRTMGSSLDCCSQALSISRPLFSQGMCWPFF